MLKGQGLLSLWNGFDPARRDAYDLWHTRQHVPERLGVPGMLRARRYDGGQGPLPEFLTLYELTSSAVLASAPYRQLLENPTPWSRSMRPSFRDFFRVGHQVVLTRGGGVGGALRVTTFDGMLDPVACAAVADATLRTTAATAIHFVAKDPTVEPVPFAVAGAGHADGAAIMVECHTRDALDGITMVFNQILGRHGIAPDRAPWTNYNLAYVLEKDDLEHVVSIDGPA
jgi:hypothetical protein